MKTTKTVQKVVEVETYYCDVCGKKYYHRKRMSYAKYLAIKSGLEVPKGYVVYHKDGDSTNNDISNLEVISRAELIFRNKRELK